MTASVAASFDSGMAFKPSKKNRGQFVEFFKWSNQTGSGIDFGVYLFWFYFSIAFVFPVKKGAESNER